MPHSSPSSDSDSDIPNEPPEKKVPATPPPRVPRFKIANIPDSPNQYPDALGPKPPTKPPPGRPGHQQRGEANSSSKPAELTGLLPQTPPRKKSSKQSTKGTLGTAFSPHTSAVLSFATGLPVHLQASPERPEPHINKKARGPRLGLNKIAHSPTKGWTSAGRAATVEAYKCFERWKNDYTPQHYGLAQCVDIVHAGNPLDRPKDPVMFCWNTSDRRPPSELKGARVPVFRAKFNCTGHCRHGSAGGDSDSDSDSSDDDDNDDVGGEDVHEDLDEEGYIEIEEDSDGDERPHADPATLNTTEELNKQLDKGARKKASKSKLKRHKCKVVLHAEVYSDELNEMYFFQKYAHPEALEKYLDTSHYIRQAMLEMASLFNLPASSIKRRLLVTFETNETPAYRRPNASQVNNVVNYIRRKERLLSDPLLSIGVFAELNPDKIFHYTPPNYETSPPSEFATGIHHPYGTQMMILNSLKQGVGHDSTYRNMNENRAPLTIMITLDEAGVMVPGFAYLSADIKIPTQVDFLREAKVLVEKMAADLVAGRVPIAPGLEDKREQLLANAQYIASYGWTPAFFMIDKSRAAKAAIQAVFPGIPIRICQFHVMQAILRWERDNAPGEHHARPVLSVKRKRQLLGAVREIQRCRHISRWERYKRRFRRRLEAIAEGSATTPDALWDYFEANWFCDEWRDYWTDMGLPEGRNREGMLSTNNWTERAFKTFNQVFLGNRTNKSLRAYRLVLILANEWFQYYQAWPVRGRVNQEALQAASDAYRVWSSMNTIQPTRRSDGRRAWTVARLPRVVRSI